MCHQSIGLIARHLEAAGIPTVVLSSALSITTGVGAPRALFVDYPLGRTAGKPDDPDNQADIVDAALHVLATASEPGVIVRWPSPWSEDESWKVRAQRPGWSVDGLFPVPVSTGGSDDRAERSDEPQWQSEADHLAWLAAGSPE